MGELRQEWRRVKFGEVVRQVKDRVDPETSDLRRFVAGEHMDTDDLRIRRWGNIGDGYLGPAFHMRFRPGHILYGSRRTYLRKIAIADFEGICANTTFVLESADSEVLLPELLPFIMQAEAFCEHSKRESKGSVNPYVNFSDLAWYEFALPPMEEQKRIVRVLRAAERSVEAMRDAVEASRTTYTAALANTFMRRHPSPGIMPISWGPTGWSCIPLETITLADAPISYGIVQPGLSVEGGVPTATSNNLNIGFRDKIHLTSPGIESGYERSRIRGGDVLVTVKGFGTGNIAIVPDFFSGNITRDVARIRMGEEVDAKFFVHLWRSPAFDRYWRAVSVGTTRPELSIGKLRAMMVPWPDAEVRHQVTTYLGDLQCSIERLESRVKQSQLLQVALLQRTLNASAVGGQI